MAGPPEKPRPMDRRLAAILAADVAGFSALAGRDEDGALRALKGHLAALVPIVGLSGGRVFNRARVEGERLLAVNTDFTVGRLREKRRRVRAMRLGLKEPVYAALLAAGLPE